MYLFKLQVETQCVRRCKYIYIYIYAIPLRSTFSGLDRMHMKTDNTPLLTIIPVMSQWGRHSFPKRNAFCHCFSPEFICLSSWGCYSTFVTWYVTSLRRSFYLLSGRPKRWCFFRAPGTNWDLGEHILAFTINLGSPEKQCCFVIICGVSIEMLIIINMLPLYRIYLH